MRRNYPWLSNPFFENKNSRFSKREFLKKIDDFVNQRQYVKITLLDWQERPLKDIQGEITSGTLTKDGSAAVRRTCSLTCVLNREDYNLHNLEDDYAINKKIFLEIGIKNETKQYKDYPILWFPQGVFFISSIGLSSSASATSSVNLNLTLKDKMAMLDGSIGGKFTSTVLLDMKDTITTNGKPVEKKVNLTELIIELVNHFGGEELNNIVVEDIPEKIPCIVRWTGEEDIYIGRYFDGQNNQYVYSIDTAEEQLIQNLNANNTDDYDLEIRQYSYGQDIGYVYEDFYYTDELTLAAGTSITSALDTIKNYLGNFEYFYDEYGIFHFREIKNYLNTSMSTTALNEMNENNYLMETSSLGKSVYTFSDNENLFSITNTPQYENIKNDFVVHGTRASTSKDTSYDVMYHVVIDDKPQINKEGYSDILVYYDKDTGYETITIPDIHNKYGLLRTSFSELPDHGDEDVIYGVLDATDDSFDYTHVFSKEELQKYSKNGDLWKILLLNGIEDKNEIIEDNVNDFVKNENIIIEKQLINALVRASQVLIDYILDKTHSVYFKTEKEFYETLKNIADKILKNIFYNNGNIILTGSLIDSNLYSQTKMLRELTYKINNLNIFNEICDNIISACENQNVSISFNEEIISEKNIIEKNITSLENQKNTCILIKNNYQRMNDNRYLKQINNLEQEIYDLDLQISWWRSRYNLQLAVSENNIFDDYACSIKISIPTSVFYYWSEEGWKTVDWIVFYGKDKKRINQENYDNLLQDILKDKKIDLLQIAYEQYQQKETSFNINKYPEQANQENYIAKDWRTEIILQGLQSQKYATDANNYYFEELRALFPTIYNLNTHQFRGYELESNKKFLGLCDGNYFFDIIDSSADIYNEYSVNAIGRRENITVSEDINCLFEPDLWNLGYIINAELINQELTPLEMAEILQSYGVDSCQIPIDRTDISNNISVGGLLNAAFNQIKYDLLIHTNYQQTISLTAIPAWYLEPNTRVTISDATTNTFGNFMIQTISYVFGAGNAMTVTCSETVEKI